MLSVERLSASYRTPRGTVQAVDNVSLRIDRGETLALVGESGCGKSTLGKAILRLLAHTAGSIRYDDTDVSQLSPRALRRWRRRMQMVFQDPSASLNPRQTIRAILETPLRVHGVGKAERARLSTSIIERVGLTPDVLRRYPHEFSGGQKQRIGIARALVLHPDLVVCDEPVSALDVSIQAQILNLLVGLKAEFDLSYLFISHDLGVVRYIADRIAVMYLGRIVEAAEQESFWAEPLHPYTRGLIEAVPGRFVPGRLARSAPIKGDLPNPLDPPSGCKFHPRCPLATETCRQQEPDLSETRPGHWVACHLVT